MKKVILVIIIAIILLYFFANLGSEGSNVIEDPRTYSQEWREPVNPEYLTIGKLMVANKIRGCGEYHVKEIESNEYVIACTRDGENWTYYVAFPLIDKIYLANDEMIRKLNPPR